MFSWLGCAFVQLPQKVSKVADLQLRKASHTRRITRLPARPLQRACARCSVRAHLRAHAASCPTAQRATATGPIHKNRMKKRFTINLHLSESDRCEWW